MSSRLSIRLALILLVGLAGCRREAPAPPPPVDTRAVDELVTQMVNRLALMHEVAEWKWKEKKPIADPVRERELLDSLAARAQVLGLNPSDVRWFFASQIEAAKLIQQDDFHRWTAEKREPRSRVRPLAELRQEIDQVNQRLLDSLVATKDVPPQVFLDRFPMNPHTASIPSQARAAATAPWRESSGR